MITKKINYGGPVTAVCDGKCNKAWGTNNRPKVYLHPEGEDGDPDDYYFLPDHELGEAPEDPGTYEGGHAKPVDDDDLMNKWCVRECERSGTFGHRWGGSGIPTDYPPSDFSRRVYNCRDAQAKYDAALAAGETVD